MLIFKFLSLIICIIGILLVPLPTEVVLRTIKIKYKMNTISNPIDPYNLTTVKYNGYCNGISGQTVSGYNVPTKYSNTTK